MRAGGERSEACWLHCLGLSSQLLQAAPSAGVRLATAYPALIRLPDLARALILPAAQHGSPAVRCAATVTLPRLAFTG